MRSDGHEGSVRKHSVRRIFSWVVGVDCMVELLGGVGPPVLGAVVSGILAVPPAVCDAPPMAPVGSEVMD